MKVLIKQAKVIDSNSSFHSKVKDILVEDGVITKIEDKIDASGAEVIEAENLHVSTGWVDAQVNFREPGDEYKEDVDSGLAAAAQGGYTAVVHYPDTLPAISSKADVRFLKSRAFGNAVDIYPVGSLTADRKGENISEMYDMQNAGAVAFSDAKGHVSTSLMSRSLLYTQNFLEKTLSIHSSLLPSLVLPLSFHFYFHHVKQTGA